MIAHSASSVTDTLGRIEAEDAALQAWAYVDRAAQQPNSSGPLAGIAFGVKDVIAVAGMPTGFGLWPATEPSPLDAWIVAILRAAGATPVGKTRTTPFAYRDPAPTFNPLDRSRTPGGSSAGSAAAVAAGHVPFALGTQTIGSVLRPAAYCGVVGFKPTYGRMPTSGVGACAPSLDHAGVIAADTSIALRVAQCAIPQLSAVSITKPRLALAESVFDATYAPTTHVAVRRAIAELQRRGIDVEVRAIPAEVGASVADANLILRYEAHAALWPLLAYSLPAELRALLEHGKATKRDEYIAVVERREAARPRIDAFLADYDAAIVPCGDAAPSRVTTGDGAPFAPWSYFGTPAINVPIPGTAPTALSLQLTATRGHDAQLLGVARIVESALSGLGQAIT